MYKLMLIDVSHLKDVEPPFKILYDVFSKVRKLIEEKNLQGEGIVLPMVCPLISSELDQSKRDKLLKKFGMTFYLEKPIQRKSLLVCLEKAKIC